MSTTLAEQLEGYAACCLKLARSAKTAAGRARFIQMAHEYRLAMSLIREELSFDVNEESYASSDQLSRSVRREDHTCENRPVRADERSR
jgi:hypothetical protein